MRSLASNFTLSFIISIVLSLPALAINEGTNVIDEEGRRQGFWQIKGYMVNDKSYNADELVEEGTYVNDKKEGLWKKYYPGGVLKSEITYVNNRPNGAYSVYYRNGQLEEKGNWARNKNTGEFKRYYSNGEPQQEFFFNDKGIRNGVQRYYHDNGQMSLEVSIVEGKESGLMKRWDESGSLTEQKEMSAGLLVEGSIQRFEKKEKKLIVDIPEGAKSSESTGDKTNDAHKFDGNGYNVLYNSAKQVTQVGEFKNGRLWNGKWNRYNQNGILMRIEIYTNGRYVGDGIIPEE